MKIYERFSKGEELNKVKLAEEYNVDKKTIQRDFEDLRTYLYYNDSDFIEKSIVYNKSKNTYSLKKSDRVTITNKEILGICKILLESRAFCKEELDILINKLIILSNLNEQSFIKNLVMNELFYYTPLMHNKKLLPIIWELSNYIVNNEVINIEYTRKDNIKKSYNVQPISIMFSEYYFYLICYMNDKELDFPTIFRIDRINKIAITKQKFKIPYMNKFNDGEFRKRVLFMYSGSLRTVIFEFTGVLEAVLDKLPTARILGQNGNTYKISVEVYGEGIYMWLKSQGDKVNIL